METSKNSKAKNILHKIILKCSHQIKKNQNPQSNNIGRPKLSPVHHRFDKHNEFSSQAKLLLGQRILRNAIKASQTSISKISISLLLNHPHIRPMT